ncbi:hypothetical protein B2G71_07905 [Novosphingobium sp. PC22D]|uniref:hypothetical protein n=1 Tax=Novosphingobium sp. PC22D TaxID=1962403 RepID=UPI000BF1F199|nr:hypothetical protein [Novosphingobium sp. PC22D]PEQ13348.1 hypothetical protein B2G71_07905 [Novosphingobium sp. PC22D]
MHVDPAATRSLITKLRATGGRGPWLAVLSELLALAHGGARLLHHEERPWSSATFSGSRHRFAFEFVGEDAIAKGEHWLEALPEHEFTIPGQLVADARIAKVEHAMTPGPRLAVEAEVLLLLDD